MRLWTAARVPAARHDRHPTTVAGGPGPSTARTGRNYRPYGLAVRLSMRLSEQVREDGEDPAVVVLARRKTELVEDRAHVLLHGAVGDGKLLAYRLVGAPLGNQFEH